MNKRFKAVIFITTLILLFSGCDTGKKNPENITKEKVVYKAGKKKGSLTFNFEEMPVPKSRRNWKEITLKSELKLGGIESELFNYPSQVKVDGNNNFYVLDNRDCSVSKFNSKGVLLKKYGRKGKGPGEFDNAFDFDVSENGTVCITAFNLNKFVVFKDEEIFEYKPTDMSINLCFHSEEDVAFFQFLDMLNISPVRRVNYLTQELKNYQNIIDTSDFSGSDYNLFMAFQGDILRYESKIVHYSNVFGYVLVFNEKGLIENGFRLLDSKKNHSFDKKFGMVAVRDKNRLLRSAGIMGEMLFVQNLNSELKYELVDFYSLETGEYQYSLKLENIGEVINVCFTDDKLYIVREDTSVEVYKYVIAG